jgi:hypothetical protein
MRAAEAALSGAIGNCPRELSWVCLPPTPLRD